jgi:membrane protein
VIFSFFFSIYVDKYTNYASFYGAMTTIALIMVWLYGCMYVLFLGGVINSALERSKLL